MFWKMQFLFFVVFIFLSVHTNLKKTCGVLQNLLCLFSKGHLNATPSLLYPWNLNFSRINLRNLNPKRGLMVIYSYINQSQYSSYISIEELFSSVPILGFYKGQIFSKYLFDVFNFLQKNERKQVDLRFHGSKVEFVCSFFGGNVYLKKNHFDFF